MRDVNDKNITQDNFKPWVEVRQ